MADWSVSMDEGYSMKNYAVWIEGYAAIGKIVGAKYLGHYIGTDFTDACKRAVRDKTWKENSHNIKNNSYFGRRFFDNEADARKSFG